MCMDARNYHMVNTQTNICENTVLWDGNPDSWSPPPGYLMLLRDETQAKTWVWHADIKDWLLDTLVGRGDIGFVWDGVYLTNNSPKPDPIPDPLEMLRAMLAQQP